MNCINFLRLKIGLRKTNGADYFPLHPCWFPLAFWWEKKKVLKGPEEQGDRKKMYEEKEDVKGLFLPH